MDKLYNWEVVLEIDRMSKPKIFVNLVSIVLLYLDIPLLRPAVSNWWSARPSRVVRWRIRQHI